MNQAFASVGAAFSAAAESYDQERRRLLPCFDDLYGISLRLCQRGAKQSFEIVDLGAGTGLMASFFAAAYPKARLTLIDLSGPMLAQARQRFAKAGDRFRYIEADYASADLPPADLYVSALSIHHLPHDDKIALYQRIFAALKPGGQLINADQVAATSAALDQFYDREWLRRVTDLGLTPSELAAARQRQTFDKPATLADQMLWLAEAGFREVDVHYKYLSFAVFGGMKKG